MSAQDPYSIGNVDFSSIRNRNERRVIKILRKILDETPNYRPDDDELRDIYALAVNSLPARYAQSGTIVLRDPIREERIAAAVNAAIVRVIENPKT